MSPKFDNLHMLATTESVYRTILLVAKIITVAIDAVHGLSVSTHVSAVLTIELQRQLPLATVAKIVDDKTMAEMAKTNK